MLNHCCKLLRIERVEDIEEERPINLTTLRKIVWQMLHELWVRLVVLIDVLHVQFLVVWNINLLDILDLQENFLFREHILEEILGDIVRWREVTLH